MLVFSGWFLFLISVGYAAEQVNTCGPDHFPCNDGTCIDKLRWCDSMLDCDDDSDELYCLLRSPFRRNPNNCNQAMFFLCEDGQCIPAVGRCDGFSSCFDNSDEENCDYAKPASSGENGKDQILKVTEGSPVALNKSTFESLPNPENFMQSDDGESPNAVINETEIVDLPVSESSNISGNPFNISNRADSNLSQATHPAHDSNLLITFTEYYTDKENFVTQPSVSLNHRQNYVFNVGDSLNSSQTEQNATSNHVNASTHSISIDENFASKHVGKPDNSNQNKSNHLSVLDNINSSRSSKNSLGKEEDDLQNEYVKLDVRDFQRAKDKASQWLIDIKDKNYGWDEETARALIALYMTDAIGKVHEKATSKELHLKIFALLSRNETKTTSLVELALYINALSASCENPRNFYGHDLVNSLRHRTNSAQASSEFVTPFIYLVLCLNNASSYSDVKRVEEMLYNSKIPRIDNEAVMSLAATCLSRMQKFSTTGLEQIAARKLYQKVLAKGLPENIYELALLTQALNEAKVNQELWNRTEAMRRITDSQEKDGSFGDILATYYAVPTLSGKSFLWIGKDCPNNDAGLTPINVLKNGRNPKIYVHYSLLFGNPVEMSQSLMLKVHNNTSFMDIMRIAATTNPVYKFKYDKSEGKPTVYSIGGVANDAERGLYWTPYTARSFTMEQGSMVPFQGDIRSFIPVDGEYVAFWRKSII